MTRSILSIIIMTLEDRAVFSRRDPPISPGPQTYSYMHMDALFKARRKGGSYWRGSISLSAFSPVPLPGASTFLFSCQPSSQTESYFSALECKRIHQKWCRIWRKPHWWRPPRKGFSVKSPFLPSSLRSKIAHRKPNFTGDNCFSERTYKTLVFSPIM